MKYSFLVKNDNLTCTVGMPEIMYSGNVNNYQCQFSFDDSWNVVTDKVAVFNQYNILLDEEGKCFIPESVLQRGGTVEIGVYGTNHQENDDLVRISTNKVIVKVVSGAYNKGTAPAQPQADIWEKVLKGIADIVEKLKGFYTKAETDEVVETGVGTANDYTDVSVGNCLTNANSYTDISVANSLDVAKAYTDTEVSKIDVSNYATKSELLGKSDIGHTHIQSEISGLQSTLDYYDEAIPKTLDDAKTYTDTQVSKIDTSTYATKSDVTLSLNDAKAYTDEKVDDIDLNNYVTRTDFNLLGTYATDIDNRKADVTIFERKTVGTEYEFVLSNNYNKSIRIDNTLISGNVITFSTNGVFTNEYMSELSFKTGNTLPSMDYSGTGIVQWIGSDCKIENNLSIFTPQANRTYDIIIYFNGSEFVGLVNGYAVATTN